MAANSSMLMDAVVERNYSDVNKMLSRGVKPNEKSERNDYSPIAQAASTGDLKMVKILLKYGADKEAKTQELDTPLMLAAKGKHLAVVEYLVNQCKANVGAQNSKRQTALFAAIEGGSIDVVKFLLSHSPDIKGQLTNGDTVLIHCVKQKKPDILPFILARDKMLLNKQNEPGSTALHIAVAQQDIAACKMLLGYTPDVLLKNKYGKTAADAAKSSKNMEIYEMLFTQMRQPNTYQQFFFACESGDLDKARSLVTKTQDLNINTRDSYGDTPLILSCRSQNADLFNFLIESGANIDLRNSAGRTPLHEAVQTGNCAFVREILRHLPKLLPDQNGVTVLGLTKTTTIMMQEMLQQYAHDHPESRDDSDNFVKPSDLAQEHAGSISSRESTPMRERFSRIHDAVLLNIGDASKLQLKCTHPILRDNQKILVDQLKPDDSLMENLVRADIMNQSELKAARNDGVEGRVERILYVLNQRGDNAVREFIDILQQAGQSQGNRQLGQMLQNQLGQSSKKRKLSHT